MARIVSWCHDHVPETAAAIRPPADAALLTHAEQATSGSWPEELRTWYTLADGTQRTPAGYMLPFYCPLPLQSVMSHWSMWQEIWADVIASSRNEEAEGLYDIARLEAQPAGTVAGMFLPSFVPIAENQMGDDMFVDTRSGRLRGCVSEFVKGNADTWGPSGPQSRPSWPTWRKHCTQADPLGDGSQSLTTAVWTGKLPPVREPCG
jgi:cell wall assembly regulator SMI1